MSRANREGRFIGRPVEWAVNESGKSKLPQFVVKLSLGAEWVNGDWQACDPCEETAYLNLIYMKDGSPQVNEVNVGMISDALGWDKSSFESLNSGDWAQVECQVVLEAEEYNGKTSVKVKYLNNLNYSGGIKKKDAGELKSLDQQYGSLLRATTGATAKPAPAAATSERVLAWKELILKMPQSDEEVRKAKWKEAIAQFFGDGTDQKSLTDAQWKEFTAALKSHWSPAKGFDITKRAKAPVTSPVSDTPEFKPDDIPF